MKKLICLLLSLMMLLSVCPVAAIAETLTEEPASVAVQKGTGDAEQPAEGSGDAEQPE